MKKFIAWCTAAFAACLMTVGLASPAAAASPYMPCSDNTASIGYGGTGGSLDYGKNKFCMNTVQDGVTHRLVFQSDGNLVFYKGGVAKWQSGTANTGNIFALQNDGNAVIYGADGSVKWSSLTISSVTPVRGLSLFYQPGNVSFNYYGISAQTPDFTLMWRTSN